MNARRCVAAGIVILMVLVAVAVLVWMSGLLDFIPRVYRANAKLLVSRSLLSPDPDRPIDDSFFETQIAFLTSPMLRRRTQQRLGKSPVEVSSHLVHFEAARLGGADIIVVSTDSASREFAREFTNSLIDEYLRFRDEQQARSSEATLLHLTREINRLSEELKASTEQIRAYVQEHSHSPSTPPELQAMRTDRERLQKLQNDLFHKLLEIDAGLASDHRQVTFFEPAVVEAKPCGWAWR